MSSIVLKIKRLFALLTEAARCYLRKVLHPKAVFWIITPEHGNLGDHAIAQAEKILFDQLGIQVIEITGKEIKRIVDLRLTGFMNGRPIFVHGGGFLGTIWFDAEVLLRDVVRTNPDSQIIVLPNTIFYENNDFGKKELNRSVVIYNRHPQLTLFMREKSSFEYAEPLYHNVKLVPDMVLSMDLSNETYKRDGCILCLRSDIERTRSEDEDKHILSQVRILFGDNYSFRDMVADYPIPISSRDKELKKQFIAFMKAELVITDRLHGMIFCAITGTPCIVIDSKSHKVRGSYEWIKDLDYIRFCDDVSMISEAYKQIPDTKHRYDNSRLMPYFSELAEDLLSARP